MRKTSRLNLQNFNKGVDNLNSAAISSLNNNGNHNLFAREERDISLQSEIKEFSKYFKDNHGKYINGDNEGPRYCLFDLILEVYRVNSLDDTIVIVNSVLKNLGYPSSNWAIRLFMEKMFNGTIEEGKIFFTPEHYKVLMNGIKRAHEEGNVIPPIYNL